MLFHYIWVYGSRFAVELFNVMFVWFLCTSAGCLLWHESKELGRDRRDKKRYRMEEIADAGTF